ncbi:TPA: hypothetical protein ACHS7S_005719 [Pseudomonas aeruginosa]
MTNELTDVRCSCGDEYPADSYDAGFIAGSGMCQNCDAAMPPKDIPAPAEQERDAALARVAEHEAKLAELERQEPSGWLAYYFGGKRNGRIYGSPCNTKEEIDRYIQQVERSDDSISLQGKPFYAAPVAQAQHSVPDGWYYDAPSQVEAVIIDIRGMWGEDDCPTYEDVAAALRRLLAAAPGKDGL